jgi:hypothetical protein
MVDLLAQTIAVHPTQSIMALVMPGLLGLLLRGRLQAIVNLAVYIAGCAAALVRR